MSTYRIKRGWQMAGEDLEQVESLTAGAEIRIDEPIPDESADLEVALALDVDQIKAIYIEADQDLTLETNDGAAPDDTIALVAGVPVLWTADGGLACPLTVDVTGLFLTNASGAEATLRCRFLVDPTV